MPSRHSSAHLNRYNSPTRRGPLTCSAGSQYTVEVYIASRLTRERPAYNVEFRDCSGCLTFGNSKAEALANAATSGG